MRKVWTEEELTDYIKHAWKDRNEFGMRFVRAAIKKRIAILRSIRTAYDEGWIQANEEATNALLKAEEFRKRFWLNFPPPPQEVM
jgi:hypothetical protein